MPKKTYASRRQLAEIENKIAFYFANGQHESAVALEMFFSNEPLDQGNICRMIGIHENYRTEGLCLQDSEQDT